VRHWGYKSRVEEQEIINSPVPYFGYDFHSQLSFSHHSYCDNIQMDIDSNLEAEQVAWEFAQAQERLRIIMSSERCGGVEVKGGGGKGGAMMVVIERATKSEEALERNSRPTPGKYRSSLELILY